MSVDDQKKSHAASKGRISRRKLLASLGIAGVSLALGASFAHDSRNGDAGDDGDGGSMGQSLQGLNVQGLTLQSLREDAAQQEGVIVSTFGYSQVGDGGAASYVISRTDEPEDDGSIINLLNGLQAHLLPSQCVNYKLFGAIGDGENDDGVQIKKAHDYANKTGLPVDNRSGEFWIKNTHLITIQTDVQWGMTKFHIDETYNSASPRFQVIGSKRAVPIKLDDNTKAALLTKLKPGTSLIPEFAPFKNSLIVVEDTNDRIGIRAGNYSKSGWARSEFFYVEEHGRIIGDLAWEFKNFTGLTAYPCDDNVLTIDGGTFYLSGDTPQGIDPIKYVHNGIAIRRSRTRIRNQWVGLEPGKVDVSLNARSGFYYFNLVYDVALENVRLIPFVYDRGSKELSVPNGTYGIGGNTVLNGVFRNVTAEGSDTHWGVFGTNLFKNFRLESCRLNRVDVHFHCWNLYLKDCEIGYKGFTLTGGGDLFIENTRCYGNDFIAMRNDYGAKWDGDIRIANCRLIVQSGKKEVCALRCVPSDFDYQYPIGYGRSIRIENFTFDFSAVPNAENVCRVMKVAAFSKITTGDRLFFPSHVEFRNIAVEGRDKGVRIIEMNDASGFQLHKKGGYDGQTLEPNCCMQFDNIPLEKMPEQHLSSAKNVNFLIHASNPTANGEAAEDALYLRIEFANCSGFFGRIQGIAAEIGFRQCLIHGIATNEGEAMRGKVVFEQCAFKALAPDGKEKFLALETELGTTFMNCTILAPIVGGVSRPDLVNNYELVDMNRAVRYNHMHTKLAKEIVDDFSSRGNAIRADFAAMLHSHADSVWR
jgi:hypothetical protein